MGAPRPTSRRQKPTRKPRRIALALLTLTVGLAALVVFIAWRDTNAPALIEVRVPVQGITRTYRILQVSDLHGSRFGSNQEKLAALIEGRDYDAIALTGDMISVLGADRSPAVEVVSLMRDHGPVFYVRGNHDDEGVAPELAAAGAINLDDAGVVRSDGENGRLVVTTPRDAGRARQDGDDVVVVFTHIPPTRSTLATLAAEPTRAALVLAGHTHAGTVRLPFVGALVTPQMGDTVGWTRLPEMRGLHIAGLRQREGTWLHISPGLAPGTYAAVPDWWRFRWGTQSQINEIVLEPAE